MGMYVALLWFDRAFRSRPADRLAARRARFAAAAAPLVPDSYTRHRAGGEGWGLDLHAATQGVRWPVHAEDAGVTAVSLGIPLGADTAAGPLGLARRALGGGDVGAEVVPPFSMIACDADGTVAVVQDWLGMGRLFVGEHDDLLAFCTRPSLLAMFLHDEVAPDVPAWETYAASGHFGGDTAPVRGVRLLGPGERYTVRPAADGWQVRHGRGTTADELVGMGLDRRGDVEKAIAEAADGIAAVSGATYDLCGGDLILGLSGGKDSRVLAAAFVGAGRLPALHTNAD
ncbi:MAG TPA: hypothetical protein VFY17_06890, partial [Pilimelia sp.]|nr:hypothetical protein [Pilimelia sp.]